MSEYKHLKVAKADGVARITFDRPKHNVFDIELMNELIAELNGLIADDELKCLVLNGEGPSFCAGVEVSDHKPEMASKMIETFNQIFDLLDQLEVPTIASVHGACLGGGMEIAIACDIIVAAKNALFGQPEIKLAFLPPYAAVRLPHLVGPSKTIEICTTGKRYSAEEAQQMGMVCYAVEDDQLAEATDKLVKEILAVRQDIPVILCTGYSSKIDRESAMALGIREYIEKPLNKKDLIQTVRNVLDGYPFSSE